MARIDNVLNTISLIHRKIFVSTRILAKLTGQLTSTKYVIDDTSQLETGFLYKSIEQSYSWEKALILEITMTRLMKFYFGSSAS